MTGPELAAARKRLGLTQVQLAGVMDLYPMSVSRIERGVKPPPVRYIRLIKSYLARHRPDDWPR